MFEVSGIPALNPDTASARPISVAASSQATYPSDFSAQTVHTAPNKPHNGRPLIEIDINHSVAIAQIISSTIHQ